MKIATYLSSALFLLSGNYSQASMPLPLDNQIHSSAGLSVSESANNQYTDRLIVKMKAAHNYDSESFIKLIRHATGEKLSYVRTLGDGSGHVIKLDAMASLDRVKALSLIIKDKIDSVKYAEADVRMFAMATTPNDEFFATRQWNLQSAASQGLNLPNAWDYTTGSSNVVVAVLDTGILKDHTGFDSTRLLAGYDLVSISERAGDSDGQDDNPKDEGDGIGIGEDVGALSGCALKDSTWHGTHVAGIIGAASNDGVGDGTGGGITGIDWSAKILPVRVLGKCGGYTSDIVDGIRWAAGLDVAGTTANSNPAHIINMSFGSINTCDSTLQDAINEVRNAGSVVIAAAGNDSALAENSTPANCDNVVVVAAHDQAGELSTSSNSGSHVDIMAPGGNATATCDNDLTAIYSLGDAGITTADSDNAYICREGSSMAAAHVSGMAALMLSGNPSLTVAEIEVGITQGARAFVAGSSCATNADTCGVGIADAAGAIANAITPSDLTMEDVGNDIQFTWQDNSAIETGFKIERSVDGGDFEDVATTAANISTYLDDNVQDLATTVYRVSAIKGEAVSESIETTVTDQGLALGDNLAAEEVSSDRVKLSWSDDSNSELGYQIDRRDNDSETPIFKRLFVTSADISTYTDSGLIDGSFYSYKIQTITSDGLNESTEIIDGEEVPTEVIEVFTDISEPTYLTGQSTSSRINLTWLDNSATETGFKLERSTDGVNYTQIAALTAGETEYTDNNVSGSSFYYYRVKAYKDENDSESIYSEVTSLSTPSSTKGAGTLHWYWMLALLILVGRVKSIKA